MPIDLEARAGGNIEIVAAQGAGETCAEYRQPEDGVARYVSHFATCPQAAAHRRKREEAKNIKRAGGGPYKNDSARMRFENPWRGHW
jgi:hypothetical protein